MPLESTLPSPLPQQHPGPSSHHLPPGAPLQLSNLSTCGCSLSILHPTAAMNFSEPSVLCIAGWVKTTIQPGLRGLLSPAPPTNNLHVGCTGLRSPSHTCRAPSHPEWCPQEVPPAQNASPSPLRPVNLGFPSNLRTGEVSLLRGSHSPTCLSLPALSTNAILHLFM